MKKIEKISNLIFSGVAMALAGVVMLLSEKIGVGTAKLLVPSLFFIGGVFAILFAMANKDFKIANQFHLLQGIGMIAFAVIIGTSANNLGEFLKYVTFFVGLFGFLEIIFGFIILNMGGEIKWNILISRMLGGFAGLIGAVFLLVTTMTDELTGLNIAGVLTIIGGLSFVVFANKIKNMPIPS